MNRPHGSVWVFIQWWKRRIQQNRFNRQWWKMIKSFFLHFPWVQLNQKTSYTCLGKSETILLFLFYRIMAFNLRETMRCSGGRQWCLSKQHLAENFGFFTAWLCDLDSWHSPSFSSSLKMAQLMPSFLSYVIIPTDRCTALCGCAKPYTNVRWYCFSHQLPCLTSDISLNASFCSSLALLPNFSCIFQDFKHFDG